MYFLKVGGTQCDQVVLGILAQLTAELLVMNLKIAQTAARLTPSTTRCRLSTELLLGSGGKPLTRMFWPHRIHAVR